MTERFTETKSFNYANQRITDLLIKLRAKGVCGCCTGRAMMYHATTLSEAIMGSARSDRNARGNHHRHAREQHTGAEPRGQALIWMNRHA